MDEELCLANLPSDIIRKIIFLGQEDIQSSRLVLYFTFKQEYNREREREPHCFANFFVVFQISPRWNILAFDRENRDRPEIYYCRHSANIYGQTTLQIRILARYAAYFGVEYWIRERTERHFEDAGVYN